MVQQLRGSYKSEISSISNVLTSVKEEKLGLEIKIKALEDKVKKIYSHLESNRYSLFSIIMHEGTAESGHYYAFIKDGFNWFKFNDFNVQRVEQTEVFNLAYGGNGNASAYCVFYMKDTLPHLDMDITHKLFNMAQGPKEYASMVPIALRHKIETENHLYQSVKFWILIFFRN